MLRRSRGDTTMTADAARAHTDHVARAGADNPMMVRRSAPRLARLGCGSHIVGGLPECARRDPHPTATASDHAASHREARGRRGNTGANCRRDRGVRREAGRGRAAHGWDAALGDRIRHRQPGWPSAHERRNYETVFRAYDRLTALDEQGQTHSRSSPKAGSSATTASSSSSTCARASSSTPAASSPATTSSGTSCASAIRRSASGSFVTRAAGSPTIETPDKYTVILQVRVSRGRLCSISSSTATWSTR